MSDIAIRAEGLSKQYRIGGKQEPYGTLRDTITKTLTGPFRRLASAARGHSTALNYETIWALKDVSFEIKAGEVVGIVGRNGAGKSTLLKVMSRITEPTTGYAEIHGRVGSLLEVGTGFHAELSGRENIYLNGAILGMHRAEINQRFDEIVDFAEVERFLDTPVKHYSSGMYMRLAFAVAAYLEPEILLVDEVLAVGDVTFQKKCLGRMSDVAKQGRTVFFVSHNLAAIRQLCTQGILLSQGQVAMQGPIDSVVREYIGTSTTSSSSVDIKLSDHAIGPHGIRVLRVNLLNSAGLAFAVPWKQPIHLALELEVTKPLPHVSFGFGIVTLEGMPLYTVHDTDTGNDPASLEPGLYRVEVVVDNPMRLGVYGVVLGAHEAVAKTPLFYIPSAIQLEVVNSTEADDLYFEHNTGIVHANSTWRVFSHAGAKTLVGTP